MRDLDLMHSGESRLAPVMAAVAELRRRLAQYWLAVPLDQMKQEWDGKPGKTHRYLGESGLVDHPLEAADRSILEFVINSCERRPNHDAGPLLAAMLFFRAYEMPVFRPLESLPDWLRPSYFQFHAGTPWDLSRARRRRPIS